MPDLRTAPIHAVRTAGRPVAHACREFGVSRKTAHKWLARYGADPAAPPAGRSRRPHSSPARTAHDPEAAVLAVRDEFGWGPRKIVADLRAGGKPAPPAPAVRVAGPERPVAGRLRGVRPPATRWRASPRPRPAAVPGVEYPPGATVREVAGGGDITWHTARILVGGGPAGG